MTGDFSSQETKTSVLIAAGDYVSGVTAWAFRLREAMQDHPRYKVAVVNCRQTGNSIGDFDFEATTKREVYELLSTLGRAVVIPNSTFDIFPICCRLAQEGQDLRTIGFCRADSETEYYRPLVWYEPAVTAFAAVSPECTRELEKRLGGRPEHIFTMPTGVTVPPRLDRNYSTKPIRLIYGGRIVQRQKRVLDFVPLIRNLESLGVDYTFDIYGRGAQLKELEEAIVHLDVGERVRIRGKVKADEMPRVWAEHDVFIQTSDFEGTSNSMLESMAQGAVPVITRVKSGIAGIVEHGATGFLVDIGDMDAMAAAIAEIAGDLGSLESMGRVAHETTRPFSIERYAEKFVEMLDFAMARPTPRWPPGRSIVPDTPVLTQDLKGDLPMEAEGAGATSKFANASKTSEGANPNGSRASGDRVQGVHDRKRKLLIMFPSPLRGGAEEYTLTIARGAIERGWEIHAAFSKRSETQTLVRDYVSLGANYHPAAICDVGRPGEADDFHRCVSETVRVLHTVKPDATLLELCGAQYGLGSLLAHAITGVPVLAVFQMVKTGLKFTNGQKNWYESARLTGPQQYVAVSKSNRELIANYLGMSEGSIAVIPNGASTSIPVFTAEEKGRVRERLCAELGLPIKSLLLLTVGRLAEQKGHDLLIPAIPHVVDRHPNAYFLWAGDGPGKDRLTAMIADYGVGPHVRMLGWRGDMQNLYQVADLLVHPTRFEGQPFSVLEAMASGLPVVTTAASGIPEIITHRKHGLLCRVEDIADLRDAILHALENGDRMESMAIEARARVEDFSESLMIDQTLVAIADLLEVR